MNLRLAIESRGGKKQNRKQGVHWDEPSLISH
jgi:hypothetical protein